MQMDLAYWQTATLHDDLKATLEALSAAHGMEKQDVLLNAAELYLSHMLIYEASSTLEGVTPETEQQKVRYAALTHAAQLLEGAQVDGFDASPLMAEGRPDSPFWASLQAIASADVQMLGANIKPDRGVDARDVCLGKSSLHQPRHPFGVGAFGPKAAQIEGIRGNCGVDSGIIKLGVVSQSDNSGARIQPVGL